MSFFKKCIALHTALLLAAGILLFALPASAETTEPDSFFPVLRFIAASDTHITDDNDVNAQRIAKMLNIGYEIADADASYNKLDALLVAGDLTNDGTKTEFNKFWNAVSGSMREGTRFVGVVAKNHDGYEMKRSELREYYTSLTGTDADFHVVINGYHFIGLSASNSDAQHYDAGQLSWLRQQLDAAIKDAPDRPVFVTHHEHVRGTVYGSSLYDGWGVPYFTAILRQYPQVVDFSGHSHYPLNDPRSVWQGKFTAIGTGAITYSEFTVDEARAYHPADSRDTATCWIVEVDANNRMRLRGMDVNENVCLCEYILDNPAKPTNRPYTTANRRAASKAPVFADNTALTIETDYGSCTITTPVAQSTDGMPIVLYRAWAKNKAGVTAAKTWTLPQYYRAVQQTEVTLKLEGLAAGDYTVCVVAETAYGLQSKPVEQKISVEGQNPLLNIFNRIGLFFRNLIERIKDLFY